VLYIKRRRARRSLHPVGRYPDKAFLWPPGDGSFSKETAELGAVLVEMILGPATGRGKALDNGVVGFLYMPLGDEFLFAPMRLALSQANKMAAKP
jgi:hypothetical protein